MGYFIAAFLLAGMSDALAAMQPFVWLWLAWIDLDKQRCLWACAGALVGLGVLIVAPGNAVRQEAMHAPHISIIQAGVAALQATPQLLAMPVRYAPIPLALLAILLFAGAEREHNLAVRKRLAGLALKILTGVVGLTFVALWANYYATTFAVNGRTQYITSAVLVVGLAIISRALGGLYGGYPRVRRIALIALALATTISAINTGGNVRQIMESWRSDQSVSIYQEGK